MTLIFEFDYTPEEMPVEKDAKIFEAGDYPDKDISISEDDLDTIVGNFAEVPVKVEHVDSPLDPLGTVKRVWRQGKDLFARLAFPRDLASFLERRGIRKLSVALHKEPLRLAEVSLVLSPRVPSASVFRRNRREVTKNMSIDISDHEKEVAGLKFALREKDVEVRIAQLKAQGKIVPASEVYAREILLRADGKISFGDGVMTFADLFERFLEAQPKVIAFGELAPASESQRPALSLDEEDLLTKLGISREQVEKYR